MESTNLNRKKKQTAQLHVGRCQCISFVNCITANLPFTKFMYTVFDSGGVRDDITI